MDDAGAQKKVPGGYTCILPDLLVESRKMYWEKADGAGFSTGL
jgi:hypothetical protein